MRVDPHSEGGADEPSREDVAFAWQVGAILRKAEYPRAGFDARVKAAVLEVQAAPSAAAVLRLRPDGWRRRRSVTLSPMMWTALAAGFAAVVSLGTLAVARMDASQNARQVASATPSMPIGVQPSRDTVYVVRFVLADAKARTVTLVGDFNAWARQATPLSHAKAGVWTTQVALPAGRHEYAFVVDGRHWVVDPAADRLADDFDTQSSVVTVGSGNNIAAQ